MGKNISSWNCSHYDYVGKDKRYPDSPNFENNDSWTYEREFKYLSSKYDDLNEVSRIIRNLAIKEQESKTKEFNCYRYLYTNYGSISDYSIYGVLHKFLIYSFCGFLFYCFIMMIKSAFNGLLN